MTTATAQKEMLKNMPLNKISSFKLQGPSRIEYIHSFVGNFALSPKSLETEDN